MEDKDKRIQRYPKICDSACSTRPASELVCISHRIYCTFSEHRLGGFPGGKCWHGACVLLGPLHRGPRGVALNQKLHIVYSYSNNRVGDGVNQMSPQSRFSRNRGCQKKPSTYPLSSEKARVTFGFNDEQSCCHLQRQMEVVIDGTGRTRARPRVINSCFI